MLAHRPGRVDAANRWDIFHWDDPFHAWGRGQVVFDDWESLRAAVERYRSAPEAHPEFGDWSPGLNDLDPFRDGQASLRMGVYIRWVYEALKHGASKQAALATATEQFAQRRGNRHVTLIVRLRIMR